MNPQAKAIVAVVEDDRRVLESLIDLLESAGYDVRPFPSATAFLADGTLHTVDCVVTDISMPGVTGLELEQLTWRERPGLPVVLITGHEHTWTQAQQVAHSSRPRFLFRKPLDGNALLAVIENATAKALPPA
jgi:FixJ family two-component response regulator